jgi:transglutaminase-like putative cysteine protease
MSAYLAPARYIDSGHPAVVAFTAVHAGGGTPRDRAVSLYYAVRDLIRYNPFLDFSNDAAFRASACLESGEGFCVGKAALYAACARAAGIPSRVGFADVKNHLTTPTLRERMGTDLFIYHGYTEVELDGRWIKATPAFNLALCERFKVKPLEFDGHADSIFHPFDAEDRRHMEYLRDRGTHADVPAAEIMAAFREAYPVLYAGPRASAVGAAERFG